MNTGIIGLNNAKFTFNFFFLMAGIAGWGKSISAAKNYSARWKKILKVVDDQTITGLTATKPRGGNPI